MISKILPLATLLLVGNTSASYALSPVDELLFDDFESEMLELSAYQTYNVNKEYVMDSVLRALEQERDAITERMLWRLRVDLDKANGKARDMSNKSNLSSQDKKDFQKFADQFKNE